MRVKKIEELLQEEKGEVSGELRIGVIPTVAPYLLPDVLTTFLKKIPKTRITDLGVYNGTNLAGNEGRTFGLWDFIDPFT